MYNNPKKTRQEIKLWFFYLVDLGIVAGLIIIATNLNKVLRLPGAMPIIFYLWAGLLGVALCIRGSSHPMDRNVLMLYYIIKRDRNRYIPIDLGDDGGKRHEG